MSRIILHSDMNCFYASVEMLHHLELAGKPMAVGGDPEARHGIVLTANYIAKRAGVKTGMALWQARQVCQEIIFVPPRMDLYLRFSRMAQEIYSEYTDQREPFGIDESWLDVTASTSIKGDGMKIAKEISSRIKYELGVTVSIGVSWNKIFAKLGSDYKKPDAITEFSKDNYKDIAWKLPVGDLLMVGRSTERTMKKLGICTIGDLAGPMFFAICMGLSRAYYGKFGEKINLQRFMIGSSMLCVVSYLGIVFFTIPALGLISCGIAGLSVGIMWPGTFSMASASIKRGGTAMFALMALAGDLGCAGGPTVVGMVSSHFSDNLQMGTLAAIVFPVILCVGLAYTKKVRNV